MTVTKGSDFPVDKGSHADENCHICECGQTTRSAAKVWRLLPQRISHSGRDYLQRAECLGKWGDGAVTGTKHIDASAFQVAPDYTFGNAPRTAAYNLYGPGNYQLDLAAVRSFPLHITENTRLDFRAEWYNVTNHTQFAVANTAVGNSSFGTVTQSGALNRKAAQFSARIEF